MQTQAQMLSGNAGTANQQVREMVSETSASTAAVWQPSTMQRHTDPLHACLIICSMLPSVNHAV
jgi:hypothetical protein